MTFFTRLFVGQSVAEGLSFQQAECEEGGYSHNLPRFCFIQTADADIAPGEEGKAYERPIVVTMRRYQKRKKKENNFVITKQSQKKIERKTDFSARRRNEKKTDKQRKLTSWEGGKHRTRKRTKNICIYRQTCKGSKGVSEEEGEEEHTRNPTMRKIKSCDVNGAVVSRFSFYFILFERIG